MNPAISVAGLTRRYRGRLALDDVTFDVEAGATTGLLGRNGAGKITLLRIVAGHEFASAGRVAVRGASPVTDDDVLRRMMFVPEDQAYPDFRVRHALQVASWFQPNWDAELAETLPADFRITA
jgi:ABC-2 type transport system ATP-binding protein